MRSAAFLASIALGCSSAVEPPSAAVSYHGAAKTVLDARCVSCHSAGGIAPFPLDTYALAEPVAGLAAEAVRSGRMPPWLPDPSCRHYQDERLISAEEREVLIAWAEGGALEGEAGSTAAPQAAAPALPPADATLSPIGGAYLPRIDRPDDYRCFPLDFTPDRELYLSRSEVRPGVKSQVHHVLLYLIAPELAPELERVDAAEAGPGYTCFGGPGLGAPQTIGAWVPGSPPNGTPGGAAIRVPRGSRVVMQLHYNTLNGPPSPDLTQVALWLDETPPANLVTVRPLAHLGLSVAADDPASIQSRVFTNREREPWRIVGVGPHMHLLGRRIQVRALSDTETRCLIDIPRWDFGWQQSYRFLPGEEVLVQPGESIRLDCTYDNSAANQPVVNGQRLPSRAITWGEGTLDEMCLVYALMLSPFTPSPPPAGEVCPGFQGCYEACRAQPGTIPMGCALQCAGQSGEGRACAQCVISSVVSCTLDGCVGPIDGFLQCLDGCQAPGSAPDCVASRCGPAILALDQCAAPAIGSGTCDAITAGCGAEL